MCLCSKGVVWIQRTYQCMFFAALIYDWKYNVTKVKGQTKDRSEQDYDRCLITLI